MKTLRTIALVVLVNTAGGWIPAGVTVMAARDTARRVLLRQFQEIEGKLLGDLTSDKSLPAARRPIKQNSIWQRYSVPSSLFREPQAQDDIPFELRLELVHSCNPGPLGFNRNVVGSLRWIEIEVELPQQAIAKRPGIARLG